MGGGIAGILCAYELKKKGIDCILVEQHRLCSGNTKNTTAKITAQHGAVYANLLDSIGVERTQQYFDINQAAIKRFEALAQNIPCEFEQRTAYLYSRTGEIVLESEARAYEKLGIPFIWNNTPPLPFETSGAVGILAQAQFHPLKFLSGITEKLDYYENTKVLEIKEQTVITERAVIQAKHIVLATHYPMVNIPGGYFAKLTQQRSYVVALENGSDLDGMFIDAAKGGYSFRNYKNFLLLGGAGDKTGKACRGFGMLRELADQQYPQSVERYAWAAQDCISLDQIPYIGVHRKGKPYLYTATGFNKWGMTGAMSAAMVISELIANGKSEYKELFAPSRRMKKTKLFANMAAAGLGLVTPGKRCTHMGCKLNWNEQEKSWDCSCHGSRFDEQGQVLDNPAKRAKDFKKSN